MPANPTQILDTATDGETGDTQSITNRRQRQGRKAHVQVEIGSGDTVVIEGRIDSSLSFVTLATFTGSGLQAIDLPNEYRARRTIDGGGADSISFVEVFDDVA